MNALVPMQASAAYPFHASRFETKDGAMSYVDVGAEKDSPSTVLLVHGTPSWSFEWRNVILPLVAAGHRCVAVDHLGFGLSAKPANVPLDPEAHARRLADFVREKDLRDITLVVHDFGGPIGLPIALDMPERVRAVVLVNTWMWSNEQDESVKRIDRLVRSVVGRLLYLWLNASPRFLVPAAFGDKKRLSRAVHRQYMAPFPNRQSRAAPYALALALLGASAFYARLWDKRAALATKPLSIVWGAKDPAFGPAVLERWRAEFPTAKVDVVEGAGHFVAEESPEAIVRAVLRTA